MLGDKGTQPRAAWPTSARVYCPGEEREPARERALAGLYELIELGVQMRRQGAQVAWTGPTFGWR